MLVGLKKDLRQDPGTIETLRETNQKPVTFEQVGFNQLISVS